MTYTDKAKSNLDKAFGWVRENDWIKFDGTANEWLYAFASFLDREEHGNCTTHLGCDGKHEKEVTAEPRKEDKPVCDCVRTWCKEHGQWECEKSPCRMAREKPQPKPEPIEELDETSSFSKDQIIFVHENRRKINELCRRLNTLTK